MQSFVIESHLTTSFTKVYKNSTNNDNILLFVIVAIVIVLLIAMTALYSNMDRPQSIIPDAKTTNIQRRYKLLPIIGKGTFGIVRKVRAKCTFQTYACKTLLKKSQHITPFTREVQCLRTIHHNHCIELFDVYEETKYIHLITELCTGGELHDRIVSNTWHPPLRDLSTLFRNIMEALAYLHNHGVVHRDLKAANFMFVTADTNTNIKIIDFGFSRLITLPQLYHQNTAYHNTNYNTFEEYQLQSKIGTPYYVAPEVMNEDYYTSKCDVWSAGVVLYLCLSRGTLPFHGEDERETLKMVKDETVMPDYNVIDDVWLKENALIDNVWSQQQQENDNNENNGSNGNHHHHRSCNDLESAKEFCKKLLERNTTIRPTARQALELDWIQKIKVDNFVNDKEIASPISSSTTKNLDLRRRNTTATENC